MMLGVVLALAFWSLVQGLQDRDANHSTTPAAAAAALATSLGKSYIAEPFITHLASSSTGQHLVASTARNLFTSSDYGQSWSQSSLTSWNWASVACCGDDHYLYASEASGSVHLSKDFGSTWATVVQSDVYSENTAITCDTSGQQVAFISFGIHLSHDAGTNWTQAITNRSLEFTTLVTNPSTGQHLLAGTAGDSIFYSDDAGVTWNKSNAPARQWKDIAVSSDGSVAIAVAESLYIGGSPYTPVVYISHDFGHTWTVRNLAVLSDKPYVSGAAASG